MAQLSGGGYGGGSYGYPQSQSGYGNPYGVSGQYGGTGGGFAASSAGYPQGGMPSSAASQGASSGGVAPPQPPRGH